MCLLLGSVLGLAVTPLLVGCENEVGVGVEGVLDPAC